jgi:hypothetical protein
MASVFVNSARAVVLGCLLISSGIIASSPPAMAQGNPAVTAFLATPGDLLKEFPSPNPTAPGDPLTAKIKDLAVANPQTLLSILSLLPNANKAQKQAIGKGLGLAASALVATNPTYANDIQQAIAKTRDRELVLAFTSDAPTGAVGGGGGGGGPGGASGGQTTSTSSTPTGTGPAQGIPGSSTPTGPFSITSSVTGTGVPSTTFASTSP